MNGMNDCCDKVLLFDLVNIDISLFQSANTTFIESGDRWEVRTGGGWYDAALHFYLHSLGWRNRQGPIDKVGTKLRTAEIRPYHPYFEHLRSNDIP